MGAGPIEDATVAATKGGETLRVAPDAPANEFFRAERQAPVQPGAGVASSPVEDYIKAQHLYIESQTEYIHNTNVGRLAAEQEAYIRAQTKYIAYLLSKH